MRHKYDLLSITLSVLCAIGLFFLFAAPIEQTSSALYLPKSVVIESPVDADRLLLMRANAAWTVTGINCIADPANSGESVVIALYESDGSGDFTDLATNGLDGTTTITCDNDGAADDGTLSNPSIDSGDWIGIDVGTVTGTVSTLTITFAVTQ